MAYLVKPWLTRYVDADGKRVTADTPGAKQIRERAKKWYGAGVPGWPKGKRVPLATHKATAQALLNRMVEEALRGQHNLTDVYAAHRERPLTEHRDEFIAALRAAGETGERQLYQLRGRLTTIFDGCHWQWLADMTELSLALMLAERRAKPRAEGGFGVQTSNFYVGAAKQFATWLVDHDRLAKSPFGKIKALNVETDRRHDRRRLTDDELLALLTATRESGVSFRGLAGPDRAMLYLVALTTGFRVSELATLAPASFALDDNPPTVTVAAKYTKNRKPVTQPLPTDICGPLCEYLAGRKADKPLWPGSWVEKGAKMIRADLEAANVAYVVAGPNGSEYADFHALRHTYVSALADSGVPVKHAQELARHSDPKLTLKRYAHVGLKQLAASVNRLPAIAANGHASAETARSMDETTVALMAAVGFVLWDWLTAPGDPPPGFGCTPGCTQL